MYKYYKKIRFDEFNSIKGFYPLKYPSKIARYYQFTYENDILVEIKYFKIKNLTNDDYFKAAIIKLKYYLKLEKLFFYDHDGKPQKNCFFGPNILGFKLNEKGVRIELIFFSNNNRQIKDRYGVYCYKFDLDQKGRKKLCSLYNRNGKQISGNKLLFQIKFKYTDEQIIESYTFLPNIYSIFENDHIATEEFRFDYKGNLIENYFLDPKDKLSSNQIIRIPHGPTFLGLDNPCLYIRVHVDNVAKYKYNYDKNGNLLTIQCYDKNNRMVSCSYEGTVKYSLSYDKHGNKVKEDYLTKADKLVKGHAQTIFKYNHEHDLVEERKLKGNNHLFESNDAIIKYNYYNDKQLKETLQYTNLVKKTLWITAPVESLKYKLPTITKYLNGNLLLEWTLSFWENKYLHEYRVYETLMDIKHIAITEYLKGNHQKLIKRAYYTDSVRKIIIQSDGVHIQKYVYYKGHSLKESRNLDCNGKLVNNNDGVAIERTEHIDDHTLLLYDLDKNMKKIPDKDGLLIKTLKHKGPFLSEMQYQYSDGKIKKYKFTYTKDGILKSKSET